VARRERLRQDHDLLRGPRYEGIAESLRADGVEVGLHYSPAAHLHEAFAALPARARPIDLSESEEWAGQELSLPMFAELQEAELERTIAACAAACEGLGTAAEGFADA